MALLLIVLFTAASLFAGGKECNIKTASKKVELTGSIARVGSGDEAKIVFRVADGDQSYTICEKTKRTVLDQAGEGVALRVKGNLVSCGEGQELMIEEVRKI
jgi:hypothetical protein